MTPRDEEKEKNTIEVITRGCTVLLHAVVRLFKYTQKRLVPAFRDCVAVEVQEGIRSKRNSRGRSGEIQNSFWRCPGHTPPLQGLVLVLRD